MCGIAGFIDITGSLTENDLHVITDCISHRGPDAAGYFYENSIGLGHRRLSILDLSEAANQPFYSKDARYVIIFNGEVYNFQEIAQELGVSLRTSSDTEVILEAYIKWGPKAINRFNGMFALAIYDKETKKVFLTRDRLGKKPVYYYYDGQSFAFASELKSLTQVSFLKSKLTIDKQAVSQFLYLGYIPRPLSIYKEIKKMDSGTYISLENGVLQEVSYWQLEEQVQAELMSEETTAKQTLKELVTSSVKYRMISDVPFGTFLSGGIDSSLVTAVAQSVSDKPIKTFSIAFDAAKYNEAQFARAVSEHLGTDHHEFKVTEKDALDLVEQLTGIYDEPYADSSAIPTLLVSELARKHVTMALSGDGGDELFFGYGMYQWANRLHNPFMNLFRKPISHVLNTLGNKYERAATVFNYSDSKRIKSHIFSQEQYLFSEAEMQRLLTPEYRLPLTFDESISGTSRALNPMEEQALFDMKYYLQDDLMVKVDRASMRHSLESRTPLLDYRIVEFALNLDPKLKYKGGVAKYLLKQVLYDYVPASFFDRPKWGFSIPLGQWLKGDLRYLLDTYLSKECIQKFNVVNYDYVKQLKASFLGGKDYLYNRIWLLIVLHKWLVNNEGVGAQ
jgi:asparagine synthase (glutamine-hydrolysing)